MIKITERCGHTEIEVEGDMSTLLAGAACIVKALYSEIPQGNNRFRNALLSAFILALGTAIDEESSGGKKDE